MWPDRRSGPQSNDYQRWSQSYQRWSRKTSTYIFQRHSTMVQGPLTIVQGTITKRTKVVSQKEVSYLSQGNHLSFSKESPISLKGVAHLSQGCHLPLTRESPTSHKGVAYISHRIHVLPIESSDQFSTSDSRFPIREWSISHKRVVDIPRDNSQPPIRE